MVTDIALIVSHFIFGLSTSVVIPSASKRESKVSRIKFVNVKSASEVNRM